MENDIEYLKELRALKGEKTIGEMALNGKQTELAERLRGEMGQDINDVLSGKKKVKLSWKDKLKTKLAFLKRLFVGDDEFNDKVGYYYE